MNTLLKGRGIFIVDASLIPIFGMLLFSGLKLHGAAHLNNHDIWHNWAVIHVISSILCLIAMFLHIKAHWNWYKSIFRNGVRKKSKITVSVSVFFVASVVTGLILLLFIEGENSGMGLWHYKISLIWVALVLIHTIKRFKIMVKGLKRK